MRQNVTVTQPGEGSPAGGIPGKGPSRDAITPRATLRNAPAVGGPPADLPGTEEEWRQRLAADRFAVLRDKATEPPFSGGLLANEAAGTYICAGCGARLFNSEDKFDSGTGWPSFTRSVEDDAVRNEVDASAGMVRTEILCARCGGHLGHVFDDGPSPGGLRYCVNSLSLDFVARDEPG